MTSIEKDPGSNLDRMICRSGPSWEGCRCSNLPTHLQGCHSSAYHSGPTRGTISRCVLQSTPPLHRLYITQTLPNSWPRLSTPTGASI
ncbi:Uncharacterized protein HZ326_12330 [Fusarium oxysporum f. sp. albedinis]|nr:Uncharacterized protein HZ326_12330 [Fusarium oxysporum f. sp. albedinis]